MLLSAKHFQNRFRVNCEACRRLTRRIFLEGLHELCPKDGSLNVQIDVMHRPVVVLVRSDVCPFIRVHAQIVDFWKTQTCERIRPTEEVPRSALFAENKFPVLMTQRHELSIVVEIEKVLPR